MYAYLHSLFYTSIIPCHIPTTHPHDTSPPHCYNTALKFLTGFFWYIMEVKCTKTKLGVSHGSCLAFKCPKDGLFQQSRVHKRVTKIRVLHESAELSRSYWFFLLELIMFRNWKDSCRILGGIWTTKLNSRRFIGKHFVRFLYILIYNLIRFAFGFAKERESKIIDLETAGAFLALVLGSVSRLVLFTPFDYFDCGSDTNIQNHWGSS